MSHADEAFRFFADAEQRTARLAHACYGCAETIEPGTIYTRYFFVEDGDAGSARHCGRCRSIWLAINARTREPVLLGLDCGESWLRTFGETEPPDIAALAFMLPGEAPPR